MEEKIMRIILDKDGKRHAFHKWLQVPTFNDKSVVVGQEMFALSEDADGEMAVLPWPEVRFERPAIKERMQ